MGSTAVAAHEWGYLIQPDKNPTPKLEQLLHGIANYINHHIAPWNTNCLTPEKLANYYRHVGGDYDSLFLETSQASLAFIYQSLGCFHTLQPEQDPYAAPTIPALTPQGFVRWQTVQLLLEPEEHVPFLQTALKRFDLTNPDGRPFPSILPKEVLPTEPDPVISEWHSAVSEKLMLEAQASAARNMPPRPQMALSDIDLGSPKDSCADSHSDPGTDMAGYFAGPRASNRSPPYGISRATLPRPSQYPNEASWSSERRRRDIPDSSSGYPASWLRRGPIRIALAAPSQDTRNTRLHHHRVDSDLSTISTSTSDSSSLSTSSASLSPVRYHTQVRHPNSPDAHGHSRSIPRQRRASHSQGYSDPQAVSSGQSLRTKSVTWQGMDDAFDGPGYKPRRDGRTGRDMRYGHGNGRADERARGRQARSTGSNIGVGGRRYVDGVNWLLVAGEDAGR